MWIKICGITSLEDAKLAVSAGADAVGFVFAESPRRMTPQAAGEITRELPPSIEKIGVFVGAGLEEIAAACQIAGLSGAQLHEGSPAVRMLNHVPDMRGRLKTSFPQLRVVETIRYDGNAASFALQLRALDTPPAAGDIRAVLVDTRIAGKQGGTGIPFDWGAAQDTFLRHSAYLRLIVAGGLRPENVWQAIEILRPWGVDVSSGVESLPGRKDHHRVTEFIRAARAAEMEFSEVARN